MSVLNVENASRSVQPFMSQPSGGGSSNLVTTNCVCASAVLGNATLTNAAITPTRIPFPTFKSGDPRRAAAGVSIAAPGLRHVLLPRLDANCLAPAEVA